MRHTIELSEAGEASLRDLARSTGRDEDALLGALADGLLVARLEGGGEPAIRSTPGVMGGDACVRNTRVPVWMLVGYKRAGYSDEARTPRTASVWASTVRLSRSKELSTTLTFYPHERGWIH